MADITKCADNKDCPIRTRCYRHTAPDSEYWQSYNTFYNYKFWKGNYFSCPEFYEKDNKL